MPSYPLLVDGASNVLLVDGASLLEYAEDAATARTTAQKFYPHSTDHDDTWGTDARKLEHAAGNALVSTTVADFSTTATVGTIVLDPYTDHTLRGVANEANWGWAINKVGSDGMSATADASRTIAAGTWTFNCRLFASSAQTGVGTSTTKVTAVVYKVSSAGARTELFRSASAATAVTSLAAATATLIAWTSTAQSAIEFTTNETLFVSYQFESIGVSVTGQKLTFVTVGVNADTSNVWFTVPAPGVRTRTLSSYTATALGSPTDTHAITLIPKAVTAVGTAVMARTITAFRVFTATATGTAVMARALTLARTFTATAAGTATRTLRVGVVRAATTSGTVARTIQVAVNRAITVTGTAVMTRRVTASRVFTSTATGTAVMARRVGVVRATTATGTAVMARRITALRTFTATAVGTATVVRRVNVFRAVTAVGTAVMTRSLISARTFTANAVGTAMYARALIFGRTFIATVTVTPRLRLEIPEEAIDRMAPGGSTTIIRKVTRIFED